jgi:hypothetical protein
MKRNLLLAMMLTFAMFCGAQTPWNGTIAESYADGDGTPENPFQIATAEQLAYLAQQTNNGTGGDVSYILTNDIVLNDGDSLLWTPIGSVGVFTGVFDGNSHIISGLYENGNKFSGLFAVTENATIKNTVLENATVLEYEQANMYSAIGGILVGKAKNTNILDCSVDGLIEIFSAKPSGGLVGQCEVDVNDTVFIKNCVNYAVVTENECTGGMTGKTIVNNGNLVIDNCVNYGNINGWGFSGGMVGDGEFIIRNCNNYGEVVSELCAGGIAGQGGRNCSITNCFNHESGAITGSTVGGIIGTAIFTVMSCCGNEAVVTGFGIDEYVDELLVGGVSGADGTIYNCYNRGDIAAIFTTEEPLLIQMGGISSTPPSDEQIRNVYNAGTIIKPSNPDIQSQWYGHIIPATHSDTLINNCYWIGNESITPYIYNLEVNNWIHIPNSSVFNQGPTATSWVLDNAQYGTVDLLEALNAGAMNQCVWVEDVDGVNGGLPIPIFTGYVEIEEQHDENVALVTVFPNPGCNNLNIKTDLQSAKVMVFDLFGRVICNQEITKDITSIDAENWPSGIYFWKVVSNNREVETGKWMKL